MRINRVEVDNFMAIGEATLSFDSKGLVLIQGINNDDSSQDSNGSGKSSLVESLNYALFNETARGQSGDTIINKTAKKNTRVLVQLVDGDRTYNVIRHRKHHTHKNRVMLLDVTDPMDVIDLTAGTDKATQDKIHQVIGCSAEVFRAAIYYGQESQLSLPDQTDKTLKAIVEEAAGIDKMQEAHQVARTRFNAVNSEVIDIENSIEREQAKITTLTDRIADVKIQADEYVVKSKAKIAAMVNDAKDALAENKRYTLAAHKIPVSDLNAEKETLTDSIRSVDKEHERLSELTTHHRDLDKRLHELELDLKSTKMDATNAKGRIDRITDEIGSACDSCGHVIEEADIKGRVVNLKKQLINNVNSAKNFVGKIKDLQETLSIAAQAVSDYKASMTDVSEATARLKEIDVLLEQFNKLVSNADFAKKRAAEFKRQAVELKDAENPYLKTISDIEFSIAKVNKEIDSLNAKLADKSQALTNCKHVVEIFGAAGIRAHILDTVTPFLNDRTAQYLGALSDGNIQAVWSTLTKTAKGELREKFAIEVSSRTGGEAYKSLSGGEKRKVRLSTALALQDLVSSRASKPIELWIGDEIDDAVDTSGLERLMAVLESKAKEKGTVLIISHNELSDWCRQHAVVVKTDGRANVDGVLNIEREKLGV